MICKEMLETTHIMSEYFCVKLFPRSIALPPVPECLFMARGLIAFALALMLGTTMIPLAQAKPCRDPQTGKYVKCEPHKPKKCRDEKGKFMKCQNDTSAQADGKNASGSGAPSGTDRTMKAQGSDAASMSGKQTAGSATGQH
ncbi:hypothetical protein [Swaminathania salitolerans]|nr:hypothetical protein [Swaminathania salitolerans]